MCSDDEQHSHRLRLRGSTEQACYWEREEPADLVISHLLVLSSEVTRPCPLRSTPVTAHESSALS